MEIDETAGLFCLSANEQVLTGLRSEWSMDEPFELIHEWQAQIERLLSSDPSGYPAGPRRNEILNRHAAAEELSRLLTHGILKQLGPYFNRDVPDTAEELIE